jgi:CspA family cold shock protein
MQGTIRKLLTLRGYGFIARPGADDVFCHWSAVMDRFDALREGQLVEYEEKVIEGRPRAFRVRPA